MRKLSDNSSEQKAIKLPTRQQVAEGSLWNAQQESIAHQVLIARPRRKISAKSAWKVSSQNYMIIAAQHVQVDTLHFKKAQVIVQAAAQEHSAYQTAVFAVTALLDGTALRKL